MLQNLDTLKTHASSVVFELAPGQQATPIICKYSRTTTIAFATSQVQVAGFGQRQMACSMPECRLDNSRFFNHLLIAAPFTLSLRCQGTDSEVLDLYRSENAQGLSLGIKSLTA